MVDAPDRGERGFPATSGRRAITLPNRSAGRMRGGTEFRRFAFFGKPPRNRLLRNPNRFRNLLLLRAIQPQLPRLGHHATLTRLGPGCRCLKPWRSTYCTVASVQSAVSGTLSVPTPGGYVLSVPYACTLAGTQPRILPACWRAEACSRPPRGEGPLTLCARRHQCTLSSAGCASASTSSSSASC